MNKPPEIPHQHPILYAVVHNGQLVGLYQSRQYAEDEAERVPGSKVVPPHRWGRVSA